MDFVTGLPTSEGFDAILVVVDRLTKMRHLIPCNDTATAPDVARLYLDHVWKLHGLPEAIVSDRSPQFTARFWSDLCTLLRIRLRLSTTFHPQTEGQSERANAVMEQYLRLYVSHQQEDWSAFRGMAEFATNNRISVTTGTSPFQANHGHHTGMEYTDASQPAAGTLVPLNHFVANMTKAHNHLRAEMRLAQNKQ